MNSVGLFSVLLLNFCGDALAIHGVKHVKTTLKAKASAVEMSSVGELAVAKTSDHQGGSEIDASGHVEIHALDADSCDDFCGKTALPDGYQNSCYDQDLSDCSEYYRISGSGKGKICHVVSGQCTTGSTKCSGVEAWVNTPGNCP